jgi:hypothetical protein
MKVELLYVADCPNIEGTRRLLKRTLRELGIAQEISEVQLSDPAQAEALKFPGSPTIRINGADLEPNLRGQRSYGLCCRTYLIDGRLVGMPSQEMIREAMRSVISRAAAETDRS